MKRYILFCLEYSIAVTVAFHLMNETPFMNHDILIDDNMEDFYTIHVVLEVTNILNENIGQNDTGLSISFTSLDGIKSEWFHLYINQDINYFGQRNYILSSTKHNFGIISSISIRIDQPELAISTIPYYLCIYGTLNNHMANESWTGCTYIQPSIKNEIGASQEYQLRDANGKLF